MAKKASGKQIAAIVLLVVGLVGAIFGIFGADTILHVVEGSSHVHTRGCFHFDWIGVASSGIGSL